MNKHIIYTLFSLILLLTACDFEVSDNGDLDGYWQLHQIDTLATGGTTDMRYSGYYWAFQVNLMEIRDVQVHNLNVLFRFDHSGDKLRIYNPIADNRQVSDSIITDINILQPYGIGHLDETLDIERLDDEKMVLRNASFRFHLRKY